MTKSRAKTPIEQWHETHPGALLEPWVKARMAAMDIQSDWAYRHGPIGLPERYAGQHGWWL